MKRREKRDKDKETKARRILMISQKGKEAEGEEDIETKVEQ